MPNRRKEGLKMPNLHYYEAKPKNEGNDYLNFAGRRLYRFLRNYGYRRSRKHSSYFVMQIIL